MKISHFVTYASICTLTLATISCGSDDGDSESAGGTGGSSAQTVTIGATFLDYLTNQPIEGLEVCTLIPEGRNPGCATTGADGKLEAPGFPVNSKLLFKLTKDEYFTTLIPAFSSDVDDVGARIFPIKRESVEFLLKPVGVEQQAGKAAISFMVANSKDDGLDGFSVAISTGEKPLYMKSLALDPNATQTDPSGLGVFVNLDPNEEYNLTFTNANDSQLTCKTRLGWPGGSDNEAKVPVKADMITYVLLVCEK